MEKEIIKSMVDDFESYSNINDDGIEFWFARDLQHLLWYSEWRNFWNIINKAKTSCETMWDNISNHFVDINKMVVLWSNSQREIEDILLTRFACYLIAMNWDSSKAEIAFSQQYFALQTRKYEIIEKRLLDSERVIARKKLAETEKELSQVIFEQTWSDKNFWVIRSKWDKALFWKTTQEMKDKWWVNFKKPLADFMPTILLKAKDFATEITIFNARDKKMKTETEISNEHITNNKTVRNTLIERWIKPEELLPEEDLKKVERKLNNEAKKWLNLKGKFDD